MNPRYGDALVSPARNLTAPLSGISSAVQQRPAALSGGGKRNRWVGRGAGGRGLEVCGPPIPRPLARRDSES